MHLVGRLGSSRIVITFIIALVAVLIGAAIPYFGFVARGGLLLIPFGVLLLVPFIVPMLQRRPTNFLEPIYIVVFGYALFLFVRAVYILAFDDYDMILALKGDPQKIPLALALAILGLIGIYVGYYSRLGPAAANALPTIGRQVSSKRLRNWGLLLIVLGTILYGLYLREVAGTDIEAYAAKDPRDPVPGNTAYFFLGFHLTGVGILFMFYWAKLRPHWRRILLVLALVSIFCLMATKAADRYLVLYLGFALLASYYMLSNKPLGLRSVFFSLLLATFYVLGVGFLRGGVRPGVRQITFADLSQLDLQTAFQRFFSSKGDLNIFDAFVRVITAIPDIYPYQFPGRTIGYLFIHFIPRILWEDKPLPTERLVNSYMIGDYGVIKAGGGLFAYSLPASFYIEGGVIAVFVGAILFGVFCRAIWDYNIKHNNIGSKMLLAVTLPIVFFYQRDGVTVNNTVWYLFYLLPAIVGLYYASVESRVGKAGSFAQNRLRDATRHSSVP